MEGAGWDGDGGGGVPGAAAAVLDTVRALRAASGLCVDVRSKVAALEAVTAVARSVEAARLAVIRSLDGEDLMAVGAPTRAGLLQARCNAAPGQARRDVAAAAPPTRTRCLA